MTNRRRLAIVVVGVITVVLWARGGPAQATPIADRQAPTTLPSAPTVTDPFADTTDPNAADTSTNDTSTNDTSTNDTSTNDTGSSDPSTNGTSTGKGDGRFDVNVDLGSSKKPGEVPSQTVTIILALTVLALVPSLLILMTSFTRFVVVLSLVRNALGLQSIPPNQVIAGLALFLSLFVMAPTLSAMNDKALQPYLDGDITQSQALHRAEKPLKAFLLANTRRDDLDLMIGLRGDDRPKTPQDTSLVTIVPAFVISELQAAFIIGIVVFIPFVVLDLVVSAGLMSLGMMMLPPVFVSLPLKLLLFVMVDGWGLVTTSLVSNYQGVNA